MADRVGVINRGRLVLVEDKVTLMRKLGKKQLTLQLAQPIGAVPEALAPYALALSADGTELTHVYDPQATHVAALLDDLRRSGLLLKDVQTTQSSLEDIFVSLVQAKDPVTEAGATAP